MERCLAGDVSSFSVLVERYQRVLYNLALRMLGNTEDARDATQSAFLKVWENLARFNPRHRFFSWIYRITVNECLNQIERRRRVEPLGPSFNLPSREDAAAGVRAREASEQVQQALLRLTPEHREVVILRHFMEMFLRRDRGHADDPGEDREIETVRGSPSPLRASAEERGMTVSDRDWDLLQREIDGANTNHTLFHPLVTAILLIAVLPPLLILTFDRSERVTREWLGLGMDTDVELLQSIRSGSISETRVGAYLRSLTGRFPGPVVADMLCLLRIHLELSIRAKGLLLAREAGLPAAVGSDVRANLEELRYLEKAIGPTGLLAMKPIQRHSSRDLWKIHVLAEAEASNTRPSNCRS